MNVTYNNERFLSEDLKGVFERFYSAEELKKIYQNVLLPSQGLLQTDIKLRKAELIPHFVEVFNSRDLFILLLSEMPKKAQQALILLAWEGDMNLKETERLLGFEISQMREVQSSYHYQSRYEIKRITEFCFIAFDGNHSQYWNEDKNESHITVRLPHAIRKILCQNLPTKPKGYHLEFLDKLPEGKNTFAYSHSILKDLNQIAGFIEQGHLQYTKNEKISKACIRKVNSLIQNKEFFPNEKSSNSLPLLRAQLLSDLIASCPQKLRENLSEKQMNPESLRQIIVFIKENKLWIHEYLMSHVRPHYYFNDNPDLIYSVFASIFEELKTNQWVLFDNIRQYHRYRGLNFNLYSGNNYYEVNLGYGSVFQSNKYRGGAVGINYSNFTDLVDIPLMQGLSFLLAALGFAEIAYTLPPDHPRCPGPKEPYLTPYDGLQGIRLTETGAYALGLIDNIELKSPEETQSKIVLNPQCLNTICHHVDPVTEMTLLEFMEKISDGHYRLTRKSFLKDCQTQEDAKQRLKNFKKHISSDLPKLWETFLDNAVQNCVALELNYDYSLFQLNNDTELKTLFSTDSVLKKYCLKVEGLKVAIKDNQIQYVKRRLKDLGYLLN